MVEMSICSGFCPKALDLVADTNHEPTHPTAEVLHTGARTQTQQSGPRYEMRFLKGQKHI